MQRQFFQRLRAPHRHLTSWHVAFQEHSPCIVGNGGIHLGPMVESREMYVATAARCQFRWTPASDTRLYSHASCDYPL